MRASETMPSHASLKPLDPSALKAMLADGQELALVDLREELVFSQNHLLFARSVPLSRLELTFARLVPRPSTRIVLCADADGLKIGRASCRDRVSTRGHAGTREKK